jgi:hypothetical protein
MPDLNSGDSVSGGILGQAIDLIEVGCGGASGRDAKFCC